MMLALACVGFSTLVAPAVRPQLVHQPLRKAGRHANVLARQCIFAAESSVCSRAVPVGDDPSVLEAWFRSEEAAAVLFSIADRYVKRDDGLFEVVSKVPFPGMVAESINVIQMQYEKRGNVPSLNSRTLDTRTECSSGPAWVRRLLIELLDSSKSTSVSSMYVELVDGRATFVSDVQLKIEMTLPKWLLLPTAAMEKSGSESLQKAIDQQLAPLVDKFCDGFVQLAAAKVRVE